MRDGRRGGRDDCDYRSGRDEPVSLAALSVTLTFSCLFNEPIGYALFLGHPHH